MDKTIKTAVSIDYKTLEENFGKKFGKVGARPREMVKFGFMITNLSKDLYPKD